MTGLDRLRAACGRAGVAFSERNMFGGTGLLTENGAMFGGSWDGGRVLLKVNDEEARGEMLSAGGSTWVQRAATGRTRSMPSWVVVPDAVARSRAKLASWVARAHADALGRGPSQKHPPARAAKRMGSLDLLEDACAKLPHSTRAMFGGHGLFAPNGGMFAGIVDDDRIVLKLEEGTPEHDAFKAAGGKPWSYQGKPAASARAKTDRSSSGMTMKEWLLVPDAMYDEPRALAEWAAKAHRIVPAKKAKKAAKKARKK
jgi:TfoX/Sxy family transcriptional regulator of competence genes